MNYEELPDCKLASEYNEKKERVEYYFRLFDLLKSYKKYLELELEYKEPKYVLASSDKKTKNDVPVISSIPHVGTVRERMHIVDTRLEKENRELDRIVEEMRSRDILIPNDEEEEKISLMRENEDRIGDIMEKFRDIREDTEEEYIKNYCLHFERELLGFAKILERKGED